MCNINGIAIYNHNPVLPEFYFWITNKGQNNSKWLPACIQNQPAFAGFYYLQGWKQTISSWNVGFATLLFLKKELIIRSGEGLKAMLWMYYKY